MKNLLHKVKPGHHEIFEDDELPYYNDLPLVTTSRASVKKPRGFYGEDMYPLLNTKANKATRNVTPAKRA